MRRRAHRKSNFMPTPQETLFPLAPSPAELAIQQEPSLGQMLGKFVESGITDQNIAAFERLLAMKERVDAKDAEKQFNAAFVALQHDIPVIVASSIIPNRGKYERFEDVMKVVGPLLVKHGFSVSFSMDFKENRILETCHLRHIAGHAQSNSFAVRAGGKADSDTQADCKAATTAKRNALLNCLNIVIRQDVLNEEQDVSIEGEPISFDKAQYLRELVRDTNSDEASFLRFAGADKYENIMTGKYETVVAALHKKARR
jgi:hypothetical protein